MSHIASCLKTHEFRKYLIPASVKRMWFYTSAPAEHLKYVAEISRGKKPGEVDVADEGLVNEEFNVGNKESKFGYEILHLYELRESLSLDGLRRRGFTRGPLQKYQWVTNEMLNAIEIDEQKKLS
jgi:hypothetical protein